MVAGESELLQSERRGAAKRGQQQPKHLQDNGATAENEHVQIRRRPVVQHYPVDIHFTEVKSNAKNDFNRSVYRYWFLISGRWPTTSRISS